MTTPNTTTSPTSAKLHRLREALFDCIDESTDEKLLHRVFVMMTAPAAPVHAPIAEEETGTAKVANGGVKRKKFKNLWRIAAETILNEATASSNRLTIEEMNEAPRDNTPKVWLRDENENLKKLKQTVTQNSRYFTRHKDGTYSITPR